MAVNHHQTRKTTTQPARIPLTSPAYNHDLFSETCLTRNKNTNFLSAVVFEPPNIRDMIKIHR